MARHLYLVRHAEAIPRGTWEPDDHRWLTEAGRRRFYRSARRFAREVGRGEASAIQAILTGQAPRAVMTAELLGRALRTTGPIEVVAELGPGTEPDLVVERLRREERTVAVVGHEPQLGQLLRLLCGDDPDTPDGLPKGGIADLRKKRGEPHFRLRGVLSP